MHQSLLHLANLSLYTRQHYPHISSLRSWLNLSISWPQLSTTLCKLEHRECKRLERDLTHLKQRATTGNSSDKENYLLAKQKLTVLEQRDLEAVKIRTKARFTEEGEKSTRYVYSLEKKKQADKSIQTLTKENLDTITSTRDILIETLALYKQLYTADAINPDTQRIFFDLPIPQLSVIVWRSFFSPLNLKALWKRWKIINHWALTAQHQTLINTSGLFSAQKSRKFSTIVNTVNQYAMLRNNYFNF